MSQLAPTLRVCLGVFFEGFLRSYERPERFTCFARFSAEFRVGMNPLRTDFLSKRRPLRGLRVLDLSRILAGPWASQIFADLGAEVLKIEHPQRGDDTRSWGPPYMKDAAGQATSHAAYFLTANRGKRSLAIDFQHREGARLIQRLASQSDVVLENFKPGTLARYGLDFHSLKKRRPGLIYASITGFGLDGPNAHLAGYDFTIQGLSGLMSITGTDKAHGGTGPVKVGVAISDLFAGLYTVIGVLAVLFEHHQTGAPGSSGSSGDSSRARRRRPKATHLDIALFDVQLAALANQAGNYLIGGEVPGPMGNRHPNIVPYQDFETKNGSLILAIGSDLLFEKFCQLVGQPDLARNSAYATNPARVRNRDALVEEIAKIMRRKTSAEWQALFEAAQIPSSPICRLDESFALPQVHARRLVQRVPHPHNPDLKLVANPLRYALEEAASGDTSGSACEASLGPPPLLGEHTLETLQNLLGLEEATLARLQQEKIIFQAS